MIKINLAPKKTSGRAQTNIDAGFSVSGDDSAKIRQKGLVNLLVILLGPLGLYLYQDQTLPVLIAESQRASQELTSLQEKNAKAAEAVVQTKKFKKEQDLLQAQINSIESLKKDRLREVKMLDIIQKDLPDKLWLTRMEMTEGKLTLQGLSTTDNELTQFMDNLSRSAYLKEVSLIRSTDHNAANMGPLKRFEISCLMETSP